METVLQHRNLSLFDLEHFLATEAMAFPSIESLASHISGQKYDTILIAGVAGRHDDIQEELLSELLRSRSVKCVGVDIHVSPEAILDEVNYKYSLKPSWVRIPEIAVKNAVRVNSIYWRSYSKFEYVLSKATDAVCGENFYRDGMVGRRIRMNGFPSINFFENRDDIGENRVRELISLRNEPVRSSSVYIVGTSFDSFFPARGIGNRIYSAMESVGKEPMSISTLPGENYTIMT